MKSSSPSQEAVEAANRIYNALQMFPDFGTEAASEIIQSAIDKSSSAQPQTNFDRVQELAQQICEIREALGIEIGTQRQVLEHIKHLRAAQPQEWSFIEVKDGGLNRTTYVAQIHTQEEFLAETIDREVAKDFRTIVAVHNQSLNITKK